MPPETAPAPTPQYRPGHHFTPAAHWLNDPNGLVWHQGRWHLFFQYHPHSSVWGPMHWGHASSTDMLHWQEHDIALAPDALGMVFSGSAVVDHRNTSGFGRGGHAGCAPLVAMYTHHDDARAQAGDPRHQHQGLAYSTDDGLTWTPYPGNPVLPNPGTKDFRDPKLLWCDARGCWLVVLAVGDHVAFHSSPDLKRWTHESDFGHGLALHQGVWECPDLFPLQYGGRTHWVLLVSGVKGGPNGGSAMQYFVGDFDGRRFTPAGPARWLDHGPDNYAGVTWSNAPGGRRVFIGWMSNWEYARELPTAPWRGAMTLPRELRLLPAAGALHVASLPVREVDAWPGEVLPVPSGPWPLDLDAAVQAAQGRLRLELRLAAADGFELVLGNRAGDQLRIGFDATAVAFYIDRREAGLHRFHPGFAARHQAPRVADGAALSVQVCLDGSSVELFGDGGLSVLTALVFPQAPFTTLRLHGASGLQPLAIGVRALPGVLAAVG